MLICIFVNLHSVMPPSIHIRVLIDDKVPGSVNFKK